MSQKESAVTVTVGLVVNTTVTALKVWAAAVTGSAAMAAEALHSAVDISNQGLMAVGLARANRTGKAHAEYAWGIAAAVAMFVTGCVWGIYDGLEQIVHPELGSNTVWALSVLAVAVGLEGISFGRAFTQFWRGRPVGVPLWRHFLTTADTTAKAVLVEDLTDIVGDLAAGVGVVMREVTGNPMWDGGAAVVVGVLIGAAAVQLGAHNARLLKEALV